VDTDSSPALASSVAPAVPALLDACRSLLTPLAELAIARGLSHGDMDELLRTAFVDAALAAHPEIAPHRAVSRVSTATGLNRREVTRLIHSEPGAEARRSPATQVFTRWLSDPIWRVAGQAAPSLPRTGAGSFETLAQSVTKDVHPRSLLEELCRLGLARVHEASDTVELLRATYVPTGDDKRLFGFLGANVGDHLAAAVANVLGESPRHLEQALFADGLSFESLERLRPIVSEQWQALVRALVPLVRQFIEEDAAAARPQDQRLRIGMYAYAEPFGRAPGAPESAPAEPVAKPARRRRRAP
jgi:hypothetical protein